MRFQEFDITLAFVSYICAKERPMDLIQKLFGVSFERKDTSGSVPVTNAPMQHPASGYRPIISEEMIDGILHPKYADDNFLELFRTVPEVYWPIDYIASRIAGASFVVKRSDDDSVVWRLSHPANKILSKPNCLMGWYEFIYNHFVYKLATGNAYIRAAMGDHLAPDTLKWKYCDTYWNLPSNLVEIELARHGRFVPLFGFTPNGLDDILDGYRLNYGSNVRELIPSWQVWHDRDGLPDYDRSHGRLKAMSRLAPLKKPIGNLIAVYSARNIIYVKRGGVGFIVSQAQDKMGSYALQPDEKQQLLNDLTQTYGLGDGQFPFGVSSVPIGFVRTNLSISELQPFDETLADAIAIAGAYGIPSVLVPRKDQSTFSNQATAEKTVYSGIVIPLAKRFCKDFTTFLGMEGGSSKYYIDCDFSDVDCLQQGLKEAAEVKKLINERCEEQFNKGIITLNDWRAQIGESMIDETLLPLSGKLKWEMTDDELTQINRVFNSVTSGTNNNTKQQEDGKDQQPEPKESDDVQE